MIDTEEWTLSEIFDALQAGADLDAPEDDDDDAATTGMGHKSRYRCEVGVNEVFHKTGGNDARK